MYTVSQNLPGYKNGLFGYVPLPIYMYTLFIMANFNDRKYFIRISAQMFSKCP